MEILEKYILRKEITAPILVILVSYIIYKIFIKFIKKIFSFKIKQIEEKKQKTLENVIKTTGKIVIIIIDVLILLDVYGIDTASLVASLGVAGLVVGLAFQDLLKDFISGSTIIFENQYCIGDIVTVNNFKGEVIDLSIKTTKIKSYYGDVKIISNRQITEVINHSITNSIAIVDIDVSYSTDLNKTIELIKTYCEKRKFKNLISKIQCLGVNQLKDSSVTIRIVAETKPMQHFEIERTLKKELKELMDENKIEIPFNQLVVHNAK